MTSQIDKIAEQNRIDRQLWIKNDRVGRSARPRQNYVKKPMTGLDEELVKEYQAQHPQSFEYVDENGETKYRKYILPNYKPELLPDVPIFSKQDLDDELTAIDEEHDALVSTYKLESEKLKRLKALAKQIHEQTNKGFYSISESINLTNENKTQQRAVEKRLEQIQDLINSKDSLKQKFESDFYTHNAKAEQVKKANLEKVNQYRDVLNQFNRGAFSTEKGINESEMEYLDRLQRNAEIETPEDELVDAKYETISKFREKMRELVRDPVVIEQVLNSLDSFDNVDNRAILLKQWELIKRKFVSVYGVNNRHVTAADIMAFFEYYLQEGESGLSKAIESSLSIPTQETSVRNIQIEALPTQNTLLLIHHTAGGQKTLFLRALTDGSHYFLLYSFTGEDGSFKEFFDKDIPYERKKAITSFGKSSTSSSEIQNQTGITPEMLNDIFDIKIKRVNPSIIAKKIVEKFGIPAINETDPSVSRKIYSVKKKGEESMIERGMGLKGEDIPQYVHFGSVILLLRKLYYENMLSVKNRQLKSVAGFRTTKVSEQFVKLIMNMINGLHPTHSDITALSSPERQIYDRLIMIANLNKMHPHNSEKTISELKKRLKLVEAEIEIGNTNPMLKKEIYGILHSLKNFKVITQNHINDYMKQI